MHRYTQVHEDSLLYLMAINLLTLPINNITMQKMDKNNEDVTVSYERSNNSIRIKTGRSHGKLYICDILVLNETTRKVWTNTFIYKVNQLRGNIIGAFDHTSISFIKYRIIDSVDCSFHASIIYSDVNGIYTEARIDTSRSNISLDFMNNMIK